MTQVSAKEELLSIIHTALQKVSPAEAVRDNISFDSESRRLTVSDNELHLPEGQGIYVLGSGKASSIMASALEKVLGNVIHDGIVIAPAGTSADLRFIQLLEGNHPVPDKNSLASTYELIYLANRIPRGSRVFFLLSGGSSALLCMPADGLELEDLADAYPLLLKSGADIHEMNVVRTALSKVKGGQLLSHLMDTHLIDLIISDVPGDQFRSIGSGPTTAGEKDYEQAFRILKKYELWNSVSHNIRTHIAKGMHGVKPVKAEMTPRTHLQFLVSSAFKLAQTVARECESRGIEAEIITPAYNQPIGGVESLIVGKIEAVRDSQSQKGGGSGSMGVAKDGSGDSGFGKRKERCLIFFGESSVAVSGEGKGGRNQELALRIARHLKPGEPVTVASIGTDGVDGPTDAAGAIIDEQTILQAKEKGLDPEEYLQNNDSYSFFQETGELVRTGPTGNNLMDLQVVLISG